MVYIEGYDWSRKTTNDEMLSELPRRTRPTRQNVAIVSSTSTNKSSHRIRRFFTKTKYSYDAAVVSTAQASSIESKRPSSGSVRGTDVFDRLDIDEEEWSDNEEGTTKAIDIFDRLNIDDEDLSDDDDISLTSRASSRQATARSSVEESAVEDHRRGRSRTRVVRR